MSNFYKLFFLIIPLIFFSCSGNREKIKRSQRIPPKEVVSILTDIYIDDGFLSSPASYGKFSVTDSSYNHIAIIKKHGYTKDQMDKTIKYYFIRDPKKLIKIYDDVLARLSEIQSRLEAEKPTILIPSSNLWTGQRSFLVPETGTTNSVNFSIAVKDTGMYELTLTAVVFKDDQSLNPRINVFFWHADTTKTGVRDNWNTVDLPKDGLRHNYTLSKRLTDTTFTHFNGWLLYNDTQTGRWEKHARIENIIFRKAVKK
jgi:hypothetical protein